MNGSHIGLSRRLGAAGVISRRLGLAGALGALLMGLAGCSMPSMPAAPKAASEKPICSVKMDDAFIARDYEGTRLLVVNLEVTNNDPEYAQTALSIAYSTKAKLDGETLDTGFLTPDHKEYVDGEEKLDEGESGVGQAVFKLGDATEGTVELSTKVDAMDYGKTVKVLDEKIDIADLEERMSESNVALTLDSQKVSTDRDGNPVLVLNLTFTNNGEKATSFSRSLMEKFFQNGIELQSSYLSYDNPDADRDAQRNYSTEVQKGVSVPVQLTLALQDGTSPVEYTFSDTMTPDHVAVLEGTVELS